MSELPASVLFVCSMNAIRSPIAEALLKALHGKRVFVQSAGVRRGARDPLVVEVMDEIGLDLSGHRPKTLDDLDDSFFDLVVTLSPEAHHRALELTSASACEVEFWRVPDPSLVEGSREQRLAAYRSLRDHLQARIRDRFPPLAAPTL
ncbi:MAG: arsenate reductase ArsC [Geminicoccaceae bacterium]|nr:arsenate reductase ArsC [Geminicoccaceae bacterium]MCX8099927.1 arsenate reductase ArsC [Geminicoccaceae bacterium]MDW8370051.1 arsenate reductase ArsC [Geminicoccaceae bacterium]